MGFTLMVMTYSFASISGAQFNPAITLAMAFSGKGKWSLVVYKGVAQFLGSLLGMEMAILMFGARLPAKMGPGADFWGPQVFAVETVYTGMLCFVYLNTLVSRDGNPVQCGNQFFGAAMGFAMLAAGYAAESVSGAVLNPAIAAAIYFEGIMYSSAHAFAAFGAGILFRVIRPDETDTYEAHEREEAHERNLGLTKHKAFSEGVGTWLFVFTIGMTHLSHKYTTARPLSGGAVYICMHYALADRSGGYFNPAVTLAVMLSCRERCSTMQGLLYILVQFVSATTAAVVCELINLDRAVQALRTQADTLSGTPGICATELIFMNLTCLAVLSTVTVKGIRSRVPQNFYHGLSYGLSYAAGGFATYGLTGGVLNPSLAIGLGAARVAGHLRGNTVDTTASVAVDFYKCLCMAIFELGGSCFAVALFYVTHSGYHKQDDGKSRHLLNDCSTVEEGLPVNTKAVASYSSLERTSDGADLPSATTSSSNDHYLVPQAPIPGQN